MRLPLRRRPAPLDTVAVRRQPVPGDAIVQRASHNIVLLGFMGTGKTTIGKQLAKRTGMVFCDMDELIEQRERRSIADIFARDGEGFFRKRERDLVCELARGRGRVIAAGGGVVLNPENVQDFLRTGCVVCLRASPEAILERVAGDARRPLLAGSEIRQRMARLLSERRPLYDAIPLQVDTSALSVDEAVEQIVCLCTGIPTPGHSDAEPARPDEQRTAHQARG